MKPLTIGFAIPKLDDATSLYRSGGIIKNLREQFFKKGVFLDVQILQNITYIDIKNLDILYLQRGSIEAHLQAVQIAKILGVKVWADYDDNLFEVPIENPAYHNYMTEQKHAVMTSILQLADLVTVSTEALKDYLSSKAQNIVVARNAYDRQYHGEHYAPAERNKIIIWRGSNTHARDLDEYSEPLIQFLNQNTDYEMVFMGFDAIKIKKGMAKPENYNYIPPLDPVQFIYQYKSISAPIHIVPLHDSIFNRCKSNIAMIEAHSTGAIVIAPDFPEWQQADFKYASQLDFFHSLNNATEMECAKDKYLPILAKENAIRVDELLKLVNF
jgi:hypothetical protein